MLLSNQEIGKFLSVMLDENVGIEEMAAALEEDDVLAAEEDDDDDVGEVEVDDEDDTEREAGVCKIFLTWLSTVCIGMVDDCSLRVMRVVCCCWQQRGIKVCECQIISQFLEFNK
jgi:hypothetical protein